jgi:hypothetical protein
MSAVQYFADFSVNTSGDNTQLPPDLLPFQGRSLNKAQFSLLLAEVLNGYFRNIFSDVFVGAVSDFNTKLQGKL